MGQALEESLTLFFCGWPLLAGGLIRPVTQGIVNQTATGVD
jgi:hypothetical protein